MRIKGILVGLVFLLLTSISVEASELRSIEIDGIKLYYHFCPTEKTKKGLLIFLHGSVRAFKNKTENNPVDVTPLLEYNIELVNAFNDKGYDIILPIAYNEYNWLEYTGDKFIGELVSTYTKDYLAIYLSGFSDGATGAFKYFYRYPDKFKGLLLFNGYPQHNNFNKLVDYSRFDNYKVVFVSQKDDKIIPYEFFLTEFRRQKMTNANTYFLLVNGKHKFIQYTKKQFEQCIELLENDQRPASVDPDSAWVYPPVDGLMVNNEVIALYTFRKKIAKGFGMLPTEYISNQTEFSKLEKLKKAGLLQIRPLKILKSTITNEVFEFHFLSNGNNGTVLFQNYLIRNAWGN